MAWPSVYKRTHRHTLTSLTGWAVEHQLLNKTGLSDSFPWQNRAVPLTEALLCLLSHKATCPTTFVLDGTAGWWLLLARPSSVIIVVKSSGIFRITCCGKTKYCYQLKCLWRGKFHTYLLIVFLVCVPQKLFLVCTRRAVTCTFLSA